MNEKSLVVIQKGNEIKKVLPEFVADWLKQGWCKQVITLGKRDSKTNKLLKGEVDDVKLVGLTSTEADLKEEIATLTAANVKLLAEVEKFKAEKLAAKVPAPKK